MKYLRLGYNSVAEHMPQAFGSIANFVWLKSTLWLYWASLEKA
jgi:hypothetical protein